MAYKFDFLVAGQHVKLLFTRFFGRNALGRKVFKNATNSCVGILNIINGVFAGLLTARLRSNSQWVLGSLRLKKNLCASIGYFVKKSDEGDGLSASFGKLDRFAVSHKPHHLHKYHLEPVGIDGKEPLKQP